MTPKPPDKGLGEMEQAQVALRDGLERVRILVREVWQAARRRDREPPEPPAMPGEQPP